MSWGLKEVLILLRVVSALLLGAGVDALLAALPGVSCGIVFSLALRGGRNSISMHTCGVKGEVIILPETLFAHVIPLFVAADSKFLEFCLLSAEYKVVLFF